MNRRRALITGGAVLCVAVAAAVTFVTFGTHSRANAEVLKPGPVPVTSPIPSDGLVLKNGTVIIKPLSAAMSQGPNGETIMTEEQAVRAGRAIDTANLPVTAVLASVTVPGGHVYEQSALASGKPLRAFTDIPAWVLTFSLPHQVDVSIGGPVGSNPPAFMASQDTMVLDAFTGEYILGFYSP